jgi:hypothetical protein
MSSSPAAAVHQRQAVQNEAAATDVQVNRVEDSPDPDFTTGPVPPLPVSLDENLVVEQDNDEEACYWDASTMAPLNAASAVSTLSEPHCT